MIPAEYQLNIYEGSNFNRAMIAKDDTDNPIDFTGYAAQMHLRETVGATTFIDWSSYLTLGTTDGTISLSVPYSATESFPFTKGVYDLELTTATNERFKLIRGVVNVINEVTR